MGLFGNNYSKPGRGVGKDDPQKRRFFIFWEIFGRKFGQLELVNLLFLVMCIPILLLMLLFNFLVMQVTHNGLIVNFFSYLPAMLVVFPMVGMTYVTRNYAREEHAFAAYDFFDQMRRNWVLCLKHGAFTYFVGFSAFIAVRYYLVGMANNPLLLIPGLLCIVFLVLYLFAQFYILPTIVTVDLPYRHILKNGMIFSVIGLFRNILLLVVLGLVWFFVIVCFFSVEVALIGVLVLFCGIPAFSSLACNFVVYPLLLKYLIKPFLEETPKTDEIQNGSGDANEKKSEYVFENGRLVKRMDHVEQIFEDQK